MPNSFVFKPNDQLNAYVKALNLHNLEQVISFLAEDFRLEVVDYGSTMTKAQTLAALEWDAGTNGHMSYDDLEVEGHRVTGIFTEVNDFLTLVGIEALQSQNTYVFDEQGRISEQRCRMLPNQPSFQEAMEPAVVWATVHRAEELAEIYPENRMIYSRKMAQRWVRLLREWHQATDAGRG